jgi:hypothetical protein
MLVSKNRYGYTKYKKYVSGRGFVDKMAQIFNSSIVPAFKSVGSYVSENRDLIAKPILGAIGALGATALTAVPAIISHIAKRNKKHPTEVAEQVSEVIAPKYKEILENIMKTPSVNPVTNIIGSGLKSF